MMMSLFSVFDPVSYLGFSFNWLVVVFLFMLLMMSFFFVGSIKEMLILKMEELIKVMFSEISEPKGEGLVMISMSLFLFIAILNLGGLFPFVFSSSGHIMLTFSMGGLVWFMSFMMGWLSDFKKSSSHLVPEGSPLVLAPFMVFIESVSQLIRPVTLSVRLAANIMAGHLIIGLIASISLGSFSEFWVSVVFQSVMLMLEWAVCFIQAFVFSVLMMLYCLEYYYW